MLDIHDGLHSTYFQKMKNIMSVHGCKMNFYVQFFYVLEPILRHLGEFRKVKLHFKRLKVGL